MLVLPLVALLLSASSPVPGPISLASPGLSTVQIDPQLGAFYADHFAQQLSMQRELTVITGSEIQSLVGFERQKQLLGCSDDSTSCVAELAGALGVEGLITGSIGKVGTRYVVNIKILDARGARPLSVHSGQLEDEDALLDFLNRAAKVAAANLGRELRGISSAEADPVEVATVASASDPGLSGSVLAVGATGATLLAAGGVFLGLAAEAHGQLVNGPAPVADLESHLARGKLFQTLGIAGLGLGVAGLGVATVLALTQEKPPVSAAIVPIQGGAIAVIEGGLTW